ncbi:MAG: HAMP domain-containing protein [Candidatus Nealsonbacteria bacterium]|nr:HAMP domain-containing protein [Candidatus Nealsonbacteria bacterium]
MSYRSIKRVLGETSLERKCRFLFGGCLLLLILGSFRFYGHETEKIVYKQNKTKGRLLVDPTLLMLHWGYLETNELSKRLVDDVIDKLRKEQYGCNFITSDKTGALLKKKYLYLPPTQDGTEEAPPSDETAAENTGMPQVKLTEEDRAVLENYLTANPQQPLEPMERYSADQKQYHYYQPVYADAAVCVTCHGGPRGEAPLGCPQVLGGGEITAGGTLLKEGDLMAVIEVIIPNGPTQEDLSWNQAILWTLAIATFFVAMVASYVIVRYVIVKPLRHLREVSDAISHGNIALRADIHTGDEFESLAVAFNRMLRHLVAAQDELRKVNTDLDGKVDELAQVNMRLYEMNTIKSDFLATMSHELRTPLNSILGFSDVLGSIDSLDEKQRRYVQNIRNSGRMLLEMINEILDLAKIESGKMVVRLTDFGIEQVVSAQCDMAKPLTEKKNIDLEGNVSPGLAPMHQDQTRVQQVLNNLLSNAIKFTPEGGRITVTARRDDESFLLMQVADTGVGIAVEDQQTVFEKFRQGRSTLADGDAMTREYSGSGLGLSIAKELCKLLGGEISVHSELGKGSTFSVRLPWKLEEQPRLDSALADGFDEFSRPRLEHVRDRNLQLPAPQSETTE